MRRLAVGLLLLTVSACSGDDDNGNGGGCGDLAECVVPWDCPVGQTCDAASGCCVFFGCLPGECPAGTFCDSDTKECTSVGDACLTAAGGCECHILNPAGELEASGNPTITLPANAAYDLQAVLSVVGAGPLPGAAFEFSAAPGTLFSVSGNTLTASSSTDPGTETLTATSGNFATCTANLVHLGAPDGGSVRFFAFDDATGEPLEDVNIVINNETTAVQTAGDGTIEVTAPGAAYNVSAFLADYNYLSIVGIPSDTTEVALPMSYRPADSTIAGFTGKADFSDYERRVLGGKPKTIKFGIVSTSFKLSSLLNFDLDLLIGPIADPKRECTVDGDCVGAGDVCTDNICELEGCDIVDGNGNHPAGCYELSIPGLVDPPIWTALPGGVLLSLAANPIKSHFDVVGASGRRYAWSLGGQVEISEIAGLVNLITDLLDDCECDVTEDACDDGCACDSDCGLKLDFGGLFNSLTPLFSLFASGVEGNLPMPPVLFSEWEAYITPPYADRIPSASPEFPLLDTAGRGRLPIREPLQVFTDFTLGALPDDPLSADDYQMEGVVVLTGVNTRGYGFVPLGLGAGLDCTTENCLERLDEDYDGVVDGGLMCLYDPDPELNGCPPGVPITELPDGHLGLFHAKAHGGLQGQEFLTVALALPITALTNDDEAIRVAGQVVRGEPAAGASNALNGSYPEFPTTRTEQTAGQFAVNSGSGAEVHWVTVATDEQDGVTTRWNIYFPSEGGTFEAPDPIPFLGGTARNPFDVDTNGIGDAADMINATHVAFEAPGVTLEDLAANNGTNLGNLLDDVDGFTVISTDVPVP